MSFDIPAYAVLFFLLIPLWFFLRKKKSAISYSATQFLPKDSLSRACAVLRIAFPLCFVSILIVGLMGPQSTPQPLTEWVSVRDYLFLIDMSSSMDEPFESEKMIVEMDMADDDDFGYGYPLRGRQFVERNVPKEGSPKKLTAARKMAALFAKSHHADRMGVMIFDTTSQVAVPLTRNITGVIRWLEDQQPVLGGTLIAQAIVSAIAHLESRGGVPGSRAIILLSDGEDGDVVGKERDLINLLHLHGIRFYWLRIKTKNDAAKEASYDKSLRTIARESDGGAWNISSEDDLKKAFAAISQIEAKPLLLPTRIGRKDLRPFCSGVALLVGMCTLALFLLVYRS